ncbi:uncharacterized protein N7529_003290 [Penicillium soppii]|uniref:uncharacterized protein n=1 Tax=Penicillium soppii TaxID=69789 RepID=UPI0025473786|nr:uncharacterized protein N7529_003290 [Penicillium soppii]KAJ5874860.1 hypothetical protein N7529_003290 [Penicillium soppii]
MSVLMHGTLGADVEFKMVIGPAGQGLREYPNRLSLLPIAASVGNDRLLARSQISATAVYNAANRDMPF